MKKLLLSLLAIFLIFEEWLWDSLTTFGHLLVRWLNLGAVERWLSQTSPNVALLAITIPLLIVTPLNLTAIWMLTHGLLIQGILLELLAKLLGTVLIARVFALTKPQLLSFTFLRIIYTTITGWMQWAHRKVVDTAFYQQLKNFQHAAKMRFAKWFSKTKS